MTERLRAVLARLEPLIIDDEGAARIERNNRESAEAQARAGRKQRLDAERVPLVEHCRKAIIAGAAMPHVGTSLEAVRRWLRKTDVPPWLFLRGGTGCGKSVASAYAIANGPGPVAWFSAQALERSFAAGFGPLADMQERAMECSLLVIDDLGTERSSAKLQPSLVRLLEARKNTDCRTVVTFNMPDSDFARRYSDPRITSRLGQQAVFVTDTGPDLRIKYGAAR
jgi:DNA replication protein DnaC